jgi:hypothetical protein
MAHGFGMCAQLAMGSNLTCGLGSWVNEELYKSDSTHAHGLMRDDPRIYEEVSADIICFQMPF